MSKLQKLKFINNVSSGWKVMFELYDWINWSNENDHEVYGSYWYFMQLCDDELTRLGLTRDFVPKMTNNENFLSRWFHITGKFKNVEDMRKLLDHDSYRIIYLRKKISVRFKDND